MANLKDLLAAFRSLTKDEQEAFSDAIKPLANSVSLKELISVKQRTSVLSCPDCHESSKLVKFGFHKGVQRYRCKICGRTFTPLTDTLLCGTQKNLHIWEKYVRCMIDGFSIRKSAEICNINKNTAFSWRHKILDFISIYLEKHCKVKGIIEADDTYFLLSFKGNKPLNRKSHKRGTPANKPGLSKEKVCVSCAIDRNGFSFSKVSALGKPSYKNLINVFNRCISRKSVLCCDKDSSYKLFARKRKIKLIQIEGGKSKLGIYHIQHINSYHSRLKQFINRFKGVSTKYLNNYLVWMNYIVEGEKKAINILKACFKVMLDETWKDVLNKPSIPIRE